MNGLSWSDISSIEQKDGALVGNRGGIVEAARSWGPAIGRICCRPCEAAAQKRRRIIGVLSADRWGLR